MTLIASIAIAVFYGAGLMWGRQTHLAIAEYWRWWVVHLWVEGFFEVFATVAIAFLFVRLGLIRLTTATGSVLLSTIVFLSGGNRIHDPGRCGQPGRREIFVCIGTADSGFSRECDRSWLSQNRRKKRSARSFLSGCLSQIP